MGRAVQVNHKVDTGVEFRRGRDWRVAAQGQTA